jgi:predicted pyridoxine 5'-phosphate oxidase superfamily flavin-nucleotide-binding protein
MLGRMVPFHTDELHAQLLAGQSSPGTGIRPFMPDQHREFFVHLSYLFVAAADAEDWPLASVLTGAPGFVTSPDATTLRIGSLPATDDPMAASFRPGAEIGILGLDLSNRRRNRANGHVTSVHSQGFTVAVNQSFGNCAQYIQTRTATPLPREPRPAQILGRLDDDARRLIGQSDTFFVASRSRRDLQEGGLDVSHRGGQPGFVDVRGDTLAVPDFRGNRFFNTLGNLLGEPRAGLLFIDFATGDALQLQGRVTIDWQVKNRDVPQGTQRVWRCMIERAWRQPQRLPFSWQFGDYAATTLATGAWRSTSQFNRATIASSARV